MIVDASKVLTEGVVLVIAVASEVVGISKWRTISFAACLCSKRLKKKNSRIFKKYHRLTERVSVEENCVHM